LAGTHDSVATEIGAIVRVAVELLPAYTAVTVAAPNAAGSTLALKLALTRPCFTATVAGTVTPGLLLVKLTASVPAASEIATVHVVVAPGFKLVARQRTEDIAGVGHSARFMLCVELPSAAFTVAVPVVAMLPAVAAKVAVLPPPATVTLPGMVIAPELELKLTTVLPAAGCDSSTWHEVLSRDITPLGLQTTWLRIGATFRLMLADWLEAL